MSIAISPDCDAMKPILDKLFSQNCKINRELFTSAFIIQKYTIFLWRKINNSICVSTNNFLFAVQRVYRSHCKRKNTNFLLNFET